MLQLASMILWLRAVIWNVLLEKNVPQHQMKCVMCYQEDWVSAIIYLLDIKLYLDCNVSKWLKLLGHPDNLWLTGVDTLKKIYVTIVMNGKK